MKNILFFFAILSIVLNIESKDMFNYVEFPNNPFLHSANEQRQTSVEKKNLSKDIDLKSKDYKMIVIKNSKKINVDNEDALLECLEKSIQNNYTTLNQMLSNEDVQNAQKKGAYLVVEYPDSKSLQFGTPDNAICDVQRLEFLIYDGHRFVQIVYEEENLALMEISLKVVEEIQKFLE